MKITLDQADLRPLIEQTVEATLARLNEREAQLGGRLGYGEAEAARLVGVAPHVLRDARLRGEVRASKIGKRVVYPRAELLRLIGESDD